MNHRYRSAGGLGEPIEVVGVSAGSDEVPTGFRWRGRSYAVGVVLAAWVEALPWWVDRGQDHRGQDHRGQGQRTAQRHVWRVEAASRTGASGVYDLYRISGDAISQWGLERVID